MTVGRPPRHVNRFGTFQSLLLSSETKSDFTSVIVEVHIHHKFIRVQDGIGFKIGTVVRKPCSGLPVKSALFHDTSYNCVVRLNNRYYYLYACQPSQILK